MTQNYTVHLLPLNKIFRDTSWNCRGPISPIEVVDLMRDIEKNGLLSPVIVMPYNKNGFEYKLAAGFCRSQAFEQLGRTEIPAFIQTDLDDTAARILNLRENLHRRDLNIVQEANAIRPLREKGMSEKAIAKEFGKSLTWVDIRLKLLELEPDIQAVAAAGVFTQAQLKKIYDSSKEERYELVKKIKDKTFRLDTVQITKPLPKAYNKNGKEVPPPSRIQTVNERVYDLLIGQKDKNQILIVNRCLAWCAGDISYNDFKTDLLKYLENEGVDPKGYRDDL